jgi:hypothetical protein
MKYVTPYGRESEGDAAHYINGNPAEGVQGSIPPANAFEHPMRELVGVISKSVITPSDLDLLQVAKGVRSQRMNFCEDTGATNLLTVALDPPLGSYTVGLPLRVRVKNTNTGASTIDAGGGRVAVRRPDGSDTQADDLPAGGIVDLVFDGTLFQMVNYLGGASAGDVVNNFNRIPYCVDTSTTPGIITANFTPPITSLAAGDLFEVKINNTNPGATIINVNSLPSKNVLPNGGGAMLQGDVHVGDVVLFFYDGTQFFITPNPAISAPTTLTVGTSQQYATIDAAMAAIARKSIGINGRVTLKLAAQVFPPFTISHPDGDRLIIQGTMLTAPPTRANFAITGNSAAARAADAANNIAMLRTRYGTEIRATAAGQSLVRNTGPGYVSFADLLLSGQYLTGTIGFYAVPGFNMICQNCAATLCDYGFFSYEAFFVSSSFANGNAGAGFQAAGPGNISLDRCGSYGNAFAGVSCYSHSFADTRDSEFLYNGMYGTVVTDHSASNSTRDTDLGNGSYDLFASNVSHIRLASVVSAGTATPPIGSEGNVSSIIIQYA